MSHDDYEVEPVPGLPQRLPAGEALLWQGAPDWRALALRDFHVRELAAYFTLMLVWRGGSLLSAGESLATAAMGVAILLPLALAGLGLVALFAWLVARSTVYTITSKRVVMRFGVALPMTVNLPFTSIESAALKTRADRTGEISLGLVPGHRLAYLMMWPHSRPWCFSRPQPALRAVAEAAATGELLARAMAADVGGVVGPARDRAGDRETVPLAAVTN